MKKFIGAIKQVVFLICVVMCMVSSVVFASAADESFEKEISGFPESYKVQLRELHKTHPKWIFVPFYTGLDWQSSVDNQFGSKSTIHNSSEASDIFKSKALGHYNYDDGSYNDSDSGYTFADKLAIEYYMDPRNFLNDYSIFMFEQLSFSEDYTVSSVETVLKGTFMYNTLISYYDSQGNKITTDSKYSEVIYLAGKTYKVNPCYLASKIRIEVGGGTSGSITGKHSTYPGIYNFYNIGANDGKDPVSNGLKYASTGTSWMRPWNSPYKSIMGGAEFIASTYISKGQDTAYLQRFNVNKNSAFALHTHQYMTNVMATHSQVYQTYLSYKNAGILENECIFSIPVFNNMPNESFSGSSAYALESVNQNGVISVGACNVRKGPSVNNDRLTDKNGANIRLANGTKVNILGKIVTDSKYCVNILKYPVWYKIKFTYNGASYTGYVFGEYVQLTTKSTVNKGEYDINYIKSNPDVDLKLVSGNVNIAQVVDSNTVKFLKQGKVEITVYNSNLVFDKLLFNVVESNSTVSGMKVTADNNSLTVSVNENTDASKYAFYLCDDTGKLISKTEQSKNSYKFSSLQSGKDYVVYARYVYESGSNYGGVARLSKSTLAEEKPHKPVDLKISNITESSYRISWTSAADATGYRVDRFDQDKGEYVTIGNTDKTYMDFTSLTPGYKCGYRVKAFRKTSSGNLYSDNSDMIRATTKPMAVKTVAVDSFTSSTCLLKWQASEGAVSYNIYNLTSDGKYKLIATSSSDSYNVENLEQFTDYTFAVSAVSKNYSCVAESVKSQDVTVKTAFSPVKNVRVSAESFNKIKLVWDAVSDAVRYDVFVYEGTSSNYSFVLESDKNSILVTDLNEFSSYRFTVKAVRKIDNRFYASEESECVSGQTILPSVSGFKAEKVTKNSYRIKWSKNQFATSYNVYRKSGSEYDKVASVTTDYYDVNGLSASEISRYKVSAVRTVNGESHESKLSSDFSVSTLPGTVKNFKATVGSSTAILKWDKVKNATCYNLYRYDDSKKAYVLIKTVTDNTYTVKGLKIGQSYKLRVRAYIKTALGTQKGDNAYLTIIAKPGKVSEVHVTSVTTNSYYLRWSESKGANCYYVFRYDSATKTYKAIAKTAKLYYKVTKLTPGRTEAYKILPAITKNSKLYVKGNYSSVYKFATKPSAVSKVTLVKADKNSLTIKWGKVSYANSYEVYRYDTTDKKYKLMTTVTMNSCTLKNLKSSTNYYLRVRAVRTLNNVDYKGGYSELFKAKTK